MISQENITRWVFGPPNHSPLILLRPVLSIWISDCKSLMNTLMYGTMKLYMPFHNCQRLFLTETDPRSNVDLSLAYLPLYPPCSHHPTHREHHLLHHYWTGRAREGRVLPSEEDPGKEEEDQRPRKSWGESKDKRREIMVIPGI